MKNPFFTIIMPVYKVEKYITKAIESVLNQRFEDFELLVVNDGSPDTSAQIAEDFAVLDSRVRVFHKPNGGLSDARNFGLQHACGSYFYFMDSDDWIEADLLQRLYKTILSNPVDIYVFGYYLDVEDSSGNVIRRQPTYAKEYYFTPGADKPPKLNSHLMGLLGYAWNKIYSKSFIDRHNIQFDKGISLVEDMLFNSNAYQKATSIGILEGCLYHYISRDTPTLIKSYHKESFALILKKHRALKPFLEHWGYSKVKIKNALADNLVQGIQYCVNNLLYYKSDFSSVEKKKQINEILQHSETKKYIDFYRPTTKSDQLYKKLIKYRLTSVLMYIKSWKKAA